MCSTQVLCRWARLHSEASHVSHAGVNALFLLRINHSMVETPRCLRCRHCMISRLRSSARCHGIRCPRRAACPCLGVAALRRPTSRMDAAPPMQATRPTPRSVRVPSGHKLHVAPPAAQAPAAAALVRFIKSVLLLQPVQAPYGLQAQGFGQTAYGAAGYRGGGGIGGVGLGGMPAAMGNAQLGMGAGLSGGLQASIICL